MTRAPAGTGCEVATFRAIGAVCEAIVELLRDDYDPADFPSHDLEFRVVDVARDEPRITAGVSLFLYRVLVDGTARAPAGRRFPDGRQDRHQLPLDLHLLLTPWGGEPSLQQLLAGWMMRTLEDHPVLPAGLLNRSTPGVFRPDETVELGVGELATEDLFQIWDVVGHDSYQLSVPYVARGVRIESRLPIDEGEPVQERVRTYRRSGEPA